MYIDDLILFSDTWKDHILQLEKLFQRLSKFKLTVNLAKSDFVQAKVMYLGYEVGQGQVKPSDAKVKTILIFLGGKQKTSTEIIRSG